MRLIGAVVLGLVVAVFCEEETQVSDQGVVEHTGDVSDKRFTNENNFNSFKGQGKDLVDWNNAFHKRFSNFRGQDQEGKLVDWAKMFKRFGTMGGQFGQEDDGQFTNWNKAFTKRFQHGNGGALGEDDKMVDWNSMYKRFGSDAQNPDLVNWSGMFKKAGGKRSKRSLSGFKRFQAGDMGFIPDPLKSGDLIDWSRVFAKRGFGGGYAGGLGGNPADSYSLQDWRNAMAKRSFGGGPGTGYFGHDGLNDYNLENWNSLLDRKRRNAPESGSEQ